MDKRIYQYGFIALVAIVIVLLAILYKNTATYGGLYLVYACTDNDSCYTLQADITKDEGLLFVDRLYFDNGGYVHLDCILEGEFCYEVEGDSRHWDITLIKRLSGQSRR